MWKIIPFTTFALSTGNVYRFITLEALQPQRVYNVYRFFAVRCNFYIIFTITIKAKKNIFNNYKKPVDTVDIQYSCGFHL